MLCHLKQIILTTLFAAFASQASAMSIQPVWLDPSQPGDRLCAGQLVPWRLV